MCGSGVQGTARSSGLSNTDLHPQSADFHIGVTDVDHWENADGEEKEHAD